MKKLNRKRRNAIIKSIIETYTDFAENTSIHGLQYTVQKESSTFEKILWFVIVSMGIIGSCFMLNLFWDRFTSNPTRSSVKTTYAPTYEIPFPAITICNINILLSAKIDTFIQNLNLSGQDPKYFRHIFPQILAYTIPYEYNSTELEILHNILDINKMADLKNVMQEVGQTCSDMLVKCKWESKEIDCMKYFVDTLTPDGTCCSFNYSPRNDHMIRTLYFGFQMGLTLLLDPMIQEERYSSLHSTGVKITIHHPGNYPGFGNTEKILAVGRETLLQLDGTRYDTSDAVRDLTPAQRGCVTEEEYNLDYFPLYSEENCITECQAAYVLRRCDCIPFYYGFPTEKKVCDLTKIPCLAGLRELRNKSRFQNFKCDCPPQCEDIFYDVLSTSTKFSQNEFLTSSFLYGVNTSQDSMLLHVYFSSQTQTILLRDTLTSTIYLLSSFGGIFSLFLGCSFISGAEIIYYVFLRFVLNLKVLNKIDNKKKDEELFQKHFQPKKFLRKEEILHGNFKTVGGNPTDENIYTLYGKNVFLN